MGMVRLGLVALTLIIVLPFAGMWADKLSATATGIAGYFAQDKPA